MKFEASQNRQTSQQRQLLCPHPFARRYRTGAVPRPVSLKAAISAQTNAPERAEPIAGHPAPGTLRLGRTEPCHRLRIRPYPPQGQSPTLPHRSDASGASVGTAAPTTGGAERLRRMYERAGADKGIVPLTYRRRSTPALCHSQNERSRPRKRRNNISNSSGWNACALPLAVCTNVSALMKESHLWHAEGGSTPALCHSQNVRACPHKRRNNVPNSSGRNARALPFAVCTNVPVLMKESYLWHTEGGARPRSAIRRTCGRVRASVGTTSPTAANGTPVLGNFQSARLFWRTRTHSTARFASALPAAKGRTNTPSSSFWKARFINLFAGKSPPLPFIRRYTIPVVNAA